MKSSGKDDKLSLNRPIRCTLCGGYITARRSGEPRPDYVVMVCLSAVMPEGLA